MTVSALDVASYIVGRAGEMTAMKLQKLLYYSQAWHMVWDENLLFSDPIEAWANGPVVPAVYQRHRRLFKVNASTFAGGNSSLLSASEKESVDSVIAFYGKRTAQYLSDLTHSEAPWREARGQTPAGAPCREVIEPAAMMEYYSSLSADGSEE